MRTAPWVEGSQDREMLQEKRTTVSASNPSSMRTVSIGVSIACSKLSPELKIVSGVKDISHAHSQKSTNQYRGSKISPTCYGAIDVSQPNEHLRYPMTLHSQGYWQAGILLADVPMWM